MNTLGYYGRDVEKATLLKAFENLGTSSLLNDKGIGQRQMVLISGTSGTGKTKLTEILKDPAAKQSTCFS